MELEKFSKSKKSPIGYEVCALTCKFIHKLVISYSATTRCHEPSYFEVFNFVSAKSF